MIEEDKDIKLASGIVDKIGMTSSVIKYDAQGQDSIKKTATILEHKVAIEQVLALLTDREVGVIEDKKEIDAVGHRIVHGGEKFSESAIITSEVLKGIDDCIDYAPLHNPHNIRGYKVSKQLLPDIPHVAVFDTAFHQTMPPYAYVYGLPYVLYKKHGIRRYGFHGTSHRYVSWRVPRLLGVKQEDRRIITAHLGNGCSMAAVKYGESVDTSMGFTPLEGLIMGTRCGDMDPAIILTIMAKEELSLHEANTLMNKHSGLIGISGVSNDMREIINEMEKGNEKAKLALDIFCYRVKKYIGSYAAAMGGVDDIVFTGGIGENAIIVREKSCDGLEFMGVEFDKEKNVELNGKEGTISKKNSKVSVWVIPTNEELKIARDTVRLVEKKS
jgi:acetate kinase